MLTRWERFCNGSKYILPIENGHPILHCLRIFQNDVIYADLNIRPISKVIKELAHNFDRNESWYPTLCCGPSDITELIAPEVRKDRLSSSAEMTALLHLPKKGGSSHMKPIAVVFQIQNLTCFHFKFHSGNFIVYDAFLLCIMHRVPFTFLINFLR